jgi:hypothetical protein
LRQEFLWEGERLGAFTRPREIEALAVTGDSEILKNVEVLLWSGGGSVGGREGLDSVLDRRFTGRLEYPADLDWSAVVTHEGDRRSGFLGRRTEQGNDGGLEEPVIPFPCLSRVRRSKKQRGHNTSNHVPPVLVPIRVERLWSGGIIQFCERLADKMGKRTMRELESWDDEGRAGDIIQVRDYILFGARTRVSTAKGTPGDGETN